MHRARLRDPAGVVRTGERHGDSVSFGGERYDLDEVDVLPPCEPSKIVCTGRNYAEHAEERGEEVPNRPLPSLKSPNAVAGHGDTVALPAGEEQVEHEAEFAVVTGEQCRNAVPEDAAEVIVGYTVMNDVSNRDDQDTETSWVRGKAFDGSAPLGSVLADPDHLPDDASISLHVNGETQQDSNIEHLIFLIPDLVVKITTYMTLEAGDVTSTGTPKGVGPSADSDTVEAEVEGVGTLEYRVRQV